MDDLSKEVVDGRAGNIAEVEDALSRVSLGGADPLDVWWAQGGLVEGRRFHGRQRNDVRGARWTCWMI